jgi:tight adherence protein B
VRVELIALKWTGVVLVAVAVVSIAQTVLTDRSSLLYRYLELHVQSLDRKLHRLFLQSQGRRIVAVQALALVVVLGTGLALGSVYPYFVLPLVAFGPVVYLDQLRRERLKGVETSVDGFVLTLANALKSTPSIGSALGYCLSLLRGPLEEEVALALKEMKVGTGLDEALLNMGARVESVQLDAALSGLLIGRKVGGDLVRILETTAETLREMNRLLGVVRSKTAEGKAQLWLLVTLPAGVLFVFDLVSDGYFAPLTRSAAGFTVIAVAVVLWVLSLVVARKVLAVDI